MVTEALREKLQLQEVRPDRKTQRLQNSKVTIISLDNFLPENTITPLDKFVIRAHITITIKNHGILGMTKLLIAAAKERDLLRLPVNVKQSVYYRREHIGTLYRTRGSLFAFKTPYDVVYLAINLSTLHYFKTCLVNYYEKRHKQTTGGRAPWRNKTDC